MIASTTFILPTIETKWLVVYLNNVATICLAKCNCQPILSLAISLIFTLSGQRFHMQRLIFL